MNVTDEELKSMQAEVVALASAWVDRGLPPEAIAGVLGAQGMAYMLEVGTRLDTLLNAVKDLWKDRQGVI